ncbi:MAG: hypothetical protein QF578_00925 [Alphaproteobacteria bacterium]|nr:hypothetical protein [Alphaproteobacteria bacterium]MDP6812152.1 hypothetical protein [Alphaproteobacteria bacterium]
MAREQIVIDPHFVGPPEITLGSYISGRMAAYLDSDTVTVTLRAPTPMGRPVGVDTDTPGEVRMYDGDTLLNEAVPGSLDIEIPEVIGLEEAKGASLRHVIEMPFPDCFGCGSARTEDTGLHLRSGPVAGRNLVAVDWLPRAKAVGAGMGEPVPKAMIWAALECPMARALDLPDMKTPEQIVLLGRMTARVVAQPIVGQPCFFMGWPVERVDRRMEIAGSLHDADGGLLAATALTFIALREGVSYEAVGR